MAKVKYPAEIPPFLEGVPHAPIATISSAKLLSKDPSTAAAAVEACQTYGFFYLDLTDSEEGRLLVSEAEQLRDLAERAFDLPQEEKLSHLLQPGGLMFGYKAAGTVKKTDPNKRPDTTEFFNISKDHMNGITESRSYPGIILDAKPLLVNFQKHAHEAGMVVLRTLARQMGLAEESFSELNRFEKPAGDHVRLTHKFVHGSDANAVGLPSHTDFGSVTLLFNWLGGLQIESRTEGRVGEWEFVKPVEGHAIVNLGDAMVSWTNGGLKSAKHRVVPAPGEHGKYDRISVVYFVRPTLDSLMKPVGRFENGAHVKVAGKFSVGDDDGTVYTAAEWMTRRATQMGS
jgi:isopenicillin N synthase-like dioxygenase